MSPISKRVMTLRTPFFLVMVLILSLLLVSCADGGLPDVEDTHEEETVLAQSPTTAPTPENKPTPIPDHLLVEPEDLDGVEVHFVHPWMGAVAETLEGIAKDFSRSNPWGLSVNVQAYGSAELLLADLEASLAEDDVPGLIMLHPYRLAELSTRLETVDLGDYFEHPEWGFDEEDQEDFIPVFFEPYGIEGRVIALPVMPQATVLFYNQTWAEELGFASPPGDPAAFQEVSCAASFVNWRDDDTATDGTGGWVINLEPRVLAGWYRVFDGSLPFQGTPTFNNPITLEAFQYLWSAREQGCFWVARDPEPYFYFSSRLALVYAGTLDQIPSQAGWLDMAEREDEWIAMGFPGRDQDVMVVDGPGLLIPEYTPAQQLGAWLFARHLLEPEVQAQLVTSGYALPVRQSALEMLEDFADDHPQWAQAVDLLDIAQALPASDGWGIAQWVLQDAAFRMMQTDFDEIPQRLEELDQKVREQEGLLP